MKEAFAVHGVTYEQCELSKSDLSGGIRRAPSESSCRPMIGWKGSSGGWRGNAVGAGRMRFKTTAGRARSKRTRLLELFTLPCQRGKFLPNALPTGVGHIESFDSRSRLSQGTPVRWNDNGGDDDDEMMNRRPRCTRFSDFDGVGVSRATKNCRSMKIRQISQSELYHAIRPLTFILPIRTHSGR